MKRKTIYTRLRIDKLLNESLDYPLTAVVAGAGYGKTTAAWEYLHKADVPYGFVTLTSGDGEVFWDKLCAAVRPLSNDAADALCVLGLPVGAWPVSRAVKLIREHCAKPFLLCVDDYQYLPEDSPVHALLETIAFEDIPNFHLLLLSRAQLNIRLATLASKEMALCIDAQTLGFTQKETDGYLTMRGLRLTKGVVDSICQSSGGWISAIYLLSEGIRTGGAVQKSSIDTLFTENLLRPLAEPDRDALYRLSVFEAFTPDLAADALGTQRIRDVIAGLLRENAFITRDELGLLRFHPLLKDYLAARCPDDEQQKNVCRRAGLWSIAHKDSSPLVSVSLFEKAGCVEELLSLLNKPHAERINYHDMDAICRMVTELPAETCLTYPFPYLQLLFCMLLSGQKQAVTYAGKLLTMMRTYFTERTDAPWRDDILGELLVIARVAGFGSFEGEEEPLVRASRLLGGKPSDVLDPADPFTFGLPMLLHSEFMEAGTLDAAVERCQHNAYELVSDGFGRGSEKLVLAEAALLRCAFDPAKRYALQAAADAAEKRQYFIQASACCVLMRRALFLGDTEEASMQLDALRALVPTATRTLSGRRVTIDMLREVTALAECFFYTSLRQKDDVPADLLDGSHRLSMAGGLGVPQMYMARAMYTFGDLVGGSRMCDHLSRLQSVCQCARLYGLILTALCREKYHGAGSGLATLVTALTEGEKDGILLPFAENPDLLPLLNKCKHSGLSEDYLQKIRQQSEAYLNVMPVERMESVPKLSEREREVLRLTAMGKSRAEVAQIFHVQENTVKAQLSAAYKKLGAKGKTEAVRLAKTHGIL